MRLAPWMPQLRREAEFLVEAMLLGDEARPRLRSLAEAGLRWERMVRLARKSAVLGPLYRSIVERGLSDLVPPALLERMREYFENNTAQNALLLHEMAGVLRLLSARGVEALPIKGTALLLAHYPSYGARHLDDIDLVVRDADGQLEEAARILEASGFRQRSYDGPWKMPEDHHHLPGYISPGGVLVELHRAIPQGRQQLPGHLERIWERGERHEVFGEPVLLPSATDLFAMTSLHALGSHRGGHAMAARHLVDMSVLAGSGQVDWELLEREYPAERGPGLVAGRALLRSAQEAGESPDGGAMAVDLFAPTLTLDGIQERARRVAGLATSPREAWRVVFPDKRVLRARYGPGWLPAQHAKHLISAFVPTSLRRR